ncbi:DUF6538 domain-containing protein [Pseudomonas sp. LP_7_YM]|uniref:DUF6538 domain-containing protein n=1 Tax=Pseudomonas sp. LP_7_YM TaxID=2485137 RepID=UPI0010E91491|nr:hypothetical protein EC915_101102 [Pseudomonas sp. LP_7_YM]
MAGNLQLEGGTWHVRRAIPEAVLKAFGGRKILSQSLKTGSRCEAMALRMPILVRWQAEIRTCRAPTRAIGYACLLGKFLAARPNQGTISATHATVYNRCQPFKLDLAMPHPFHYELLPFP